MLADYPAFVRLYDVLQLQGEDLRPLGWAARRARLEALMPQLDPQRFDISAVIEADNLDQLAEIRARARDDAIEGVMLKRRDAPYVSGRRAGLWYKWKRDPLLIDCVLMYAQRGSGKRSRPARGLRDRASVPDPGKSVEARCVGKRGRASRYLKSRAGPDYRGKCPLFGPSDSRGMRKIRTWDRICVFFKGNAAVPAWIRHLFFRRRVSRNPLACVRQP